MAATVQTESSGESQLQHWIMVKEGQAKFISAACFPKTELNYVQCKNASTRTNNQETVTNKDGSMHDVRDYTSVFFPHDWTKLDFMTDPIFHELYSTESLNNEESMNMENYIARSHSITVFGDCLSLLVSNNTVWSLLR